MAASKTTKTAKSTTGPDGSSADLLKTLRALRSDGATGVLSVTGSWGGRVYLMGGEVIACGADEDQRTLAALLVAAGASQATIDAAQTNLDPDSDLADVLVSTGLVGGAEMMTARSELFRDNLAWLTAIPDGAVEFEAQDSVFPDNMQFGLDQDELARDLKLWRSRVDPVVTAMTRDPAPVWRRQGDVAAGKYEAAWAALEDGLKPRALVDALGPPRRDALEAIAGWLSAGSVVEDGAEPAESDTTAGGAEDDYSKAARGAFIKSYDVLDKVDLSGVAVIGANADDDEAVALDDDDAFAIEAGEVEVEADDGGTRPGIETVADVGEPDDDDFAVFGDAPPVHADGSSADDEDEYELMADESIDESVLEIIHDDSANESSDGAVLAEEIEIADLDAIDDASPYAREELQAFNEKIAVFNSIFRIIFGTFADHIGADSAEQRFNALVGSGQRQYPELFEGLRINRDGGLHAPSLIRNLANCGQGDSASLLHQGLYELIFSHLYDAKDVLPAEAETAMMERVVVFERQLQQM
jgi:hypothetical protein